MPSEAELLQGIAYKRVLDIDLHGSPNPIIHTDDMLLTSNMILQLKARKW